MRSKISSPATTLITLMNVYHFIQLQTGIIKTVLPSYKGYLIKRKGIYDRREKAVLLEARAMREDTIGSTFWND